jgi:NTE family protein
MMRDIRNLSFEGGGVKGMAYAGFIFGLEEAAIMKNILQVAGTSAGAITAALVSLRYTAGEIHDIMMKTDFSTFEDSENPFRIATQYGIYQGDVFLSWMKERIKGMISTPDATFAEFEKAGCIDLHIFAYDVTDERLIRFCAKTTPQVIVAEAVRASMSIPFFFKGFQFSTGHPNDHIHVDGGTVYNYPVDAFDTDGPNPQTLGAFLRGVPSPAGVRYNELIKFTRSIFNGILDSQNINLYTNKEQLARTVQIPSLGISATDFSLTGDQKQALYDSGLASIRSFLLA